VDRPERPQTIRRKAFIPQQKLPEADEFAAQMRTVVVFSRRPKNVTQLALGKL
jgi:hypothetical protein